MTFSNFVSLAICSGCLQPSWCKEHGCIQPPSAGATTTSLDVRYDALTKAHIAAKAGQDAARNWCPNLEGDFSAILMHLDVALRDSLGEQNAAGQASVGEAHGTRDGISPEISPPASAAPFSPDDATRARVADIISTNPLIQSLLYDIDLLPEQIRDARRYGYMLAVIDHMLVFASRVAAQREEK